MSFTCPSCASEDVRRLQLIYREGYSAVNASTNTVGLARGGGYTSVGSARSQTSGTQQTLLSMGAAPPEKRKVGGKIFGLLVGVLFILAGLGSPGAGLLFGLALAGICGYVLKQAMDYNGAVYPAELQRWQNTFMCNRCGNHFIPRALAAAATAGV
jgi:predicted RNA-binding Zn-ribbon protein involved in translation (DUF1610 family)